MLINRRNLTKKCSEATFIITLLVGIFFVGRYSRNVITKSSSTGLVSEQGIPDNDGPNDPQTPETTGNDQHEEVIRELQPVTWEYDRQFKNPCIRKSDNTLQCIPYFYMAGSVESGAKLLYRAIMQHPQAVFPGFEEANFFSKRDLEDLEAGGIQDYFKKYSNASDMILGHTNSKQDPDEYNNLITGDATPYMYLSWNRTHITNGKKPGFSILEYIHHIVPHAKIIVIFREPVERLFADYCKRTKWDKEHTTPSPRHFHERSCRAVSMYNNLYKRSTRSDHTYDRDLSDVKSLTQSQTTLKYDLLNLTETLNYVNKQLQETRLQLSHAQNNAHTFLSANPGSVYVRWGRSKCSSDAELVYSGYAGGSIWTSAGAASNYICLVQDPVLIANVTGDKGAQVFGAEYVFDNAQWVSASNNLYGKDITFQDVPCAVCRTPGLSTVMVPGKTTCSNGWREEYSGYLSAGYYGHSAASEFVCLDREGEVIPNTSNKELGKLFYSVRARCGSLPCPPYEEGKDLTCVVCSK